MFKVILLKSIPGIKKGSISECDIGDIYAEWYSKDRFCYEVSLKEVFKRKSWFKIEDSIFCTFCNKNTSYLKGTTDSKGVFQCDDCYNKFI